MQPTRNPGEDSQADSITIILNALESGQNVILIGPIGAGKSTLLSQIEKSFKGRAQIFSVSLDQSTPDLSKTLIQSSTQKTSQEEIILEAVENLAKKPGYILIDDLDHTDRWEEWLTAFCLKSNALRFVISCTRTPKIDPILLSEVCVHRHSGLSKNEYQTLVQKLAPNLAKMNDILDSFFKSTNGNPYFLKLAIGLLKASEINIQDLSGKTISKILFEKWFSKATRGISNSDLSIVLQYCLVKSDTAYKHHLLQVLKTRRVAIVDDPNFDGFTNLIPEHLGKTLSQQSREQIRKDLKEKFELESLLEYVEQGLELELTQSLPTEFETLLQTPGRAKEDRYYFDLVERYLVENPLSKLLPYTLTFRGLFLCNSTDHKEGLENLKMGYEKGRELYPQNSFFLERWTLWIHRSTHSLETLHHLHAHWVEFKSNEIEFLHLLAIEVRIRSRISNQITKTEIDTLLETLTRKIPNRSYRFFLALNHIAYGYRELGHPTLAADIYFQANKGFDSFPDSNESLGAHGTRLHASNMVEPDTNRIIEQALELENRAIILGNRHWLKVARSSVDSPLFNYGKFQFLKSRIKHALERIKELGIGPTDHEDVISWMSFTFAFLDKDLQVAHMNLKVLAPNTRHPYPLIFNALNTLGEVMANPEVQLPDTTQLFRELLWDLLGIHYYFLANYNLSFLLPNDMAYFRKLIHQPDPAPRSGWNKGAFSRYELFFGNLADAEKLAQEAFEIYKPYKSYLDHSLILHSLTLCALARRDFTQALSNLSAWEVYVRKMEDYPDNRWFFILKAIAIHQTERDRTKRVNGIRTLIDEISSQSNLHYFRRILLAGDLKPGENIGVTPYAKQKWHFHKILSMSGVIDERPISCLTHDGRAFIPHYTVDEWSQELDIWVDEAAGVAKLRGASFDLFESPALAAFLRTLFEAKPKPLDKESLVKLVWNEIYNPLIHDTRIYTNIKRLREIFDSTLNEGFILQTDGNYSIHPKIRFLWAYRDGALPAAEASTRADWILNRIRTQGSIKREEIESELKIGSTVAKQELKALAEKGLIQSAGAGRATRYILKR